MRLPDNHCRASATAALIGAAVALAAPLPATARHHAPSAPPLPAANGPAADFPVTLGDAYSAGGVVFTPADTMNLDSVGYAAVGQDGGTLVSAAHHTLPVPSYVEVTSLESGRTILVRVDRRGPMQSADLIELSPAAAAQLGLADRGAVRVRRVNPSEQDRALLRAGAAAPERMPTPKALLAVLNRRLDPVQTVTLARSATSAAPDTADSPVTVAHLAHVSRAATPKVPARATAPHPAPGDVAMAPGAGFGAAGASYAQDGDDAVSAPPKTPGRPRAIAKASPKPARVPVDIVAEAPPAATGEAIRSGMLVIQAGAFAQKENARSVAAKLGATVAGNGRLWRVRMGPFSSRGQAEAALVKVRAAGYSEARIQHAD